MVYGIIVTLLFSLVFLPKLVEQIGKKGIVRVINEIGESFVKWDDPTAFFFTYIIGYIIIWWKPLWGSLIIIIGCLLFLFTHIDNTWNLIFFIPTFLVGFLYLLTGYLKKKNK